MGRPKLPPQQKKSERIGLRITPGDRQRLRELARHPAVMGDGKPLTLAAAAGMCFEDGLEFFERQVAGAVP